MSRAVVVMPDDPGLLRAAYATLLEVALDADQRPGIREIARGWCRLYELSRRKLKTELYTEHDGTETAPEIPSGKHRVGRSG